MIDPRSVPMHILSSEFERAFALVEGSRHLACSLAGMIGDESIIFVRAQFLKTLQEEPDAQQKLIDVAGRDAHLNLNVIYGQGGWNRYSVRATGEVIFLRGPGETLGQTEYAKEVGFQIK